MSPAHWDFTCERRVLLNEGAQLRRYVDFVHVLPRTFGARTGRRASRRVALRPGGVVQYRMNRGLSRTLAEAVRAYGAGTAFEWVGLLCRYGATRATLRLARPSGPHLEPFASITDLATGRERPAHLALTAEQWVVTVEGCAPRSLLCIYWPIGE